MTTANTSLSTKHFFQQENVQAKFKELLGAKSTAFVTSLLQVVSSDKNLANVDPKSIYQAAAMAAVIDLPINNNLGYAYIVPYSGKAQFQIGYKGFTQLALRSKEYLKLNVVEVYANQFKSYDPINEVLIADFTIEGEGAIAGYCAYFKLINGFEKTVYWSTKKVTEHAKKYSKAFSSEWGKTPWKDPEQFPEMAKKTVLKNMLSKWGVLSLEMQKAVVADQAVIKDIETEDIDYIDHPATPDTVSTENGEMTLKDGQKSAAISSKAEQKVEDKNGKSEPAPTSYVSLKVITNIDTTNVRSESVPAGYVGICTSDDGSMVSLDNGYINCPRGLIKQADANALTTAERTAGSLPLASEPAAIRTDYTLPELEAMETTPLIRQIAAKYCDIDKLGQSRVTNKLLRNVIIAAQNGTLKKLITQYYPDKEDAIKTDYVEKEVATSPAAAVGQVSVDGLLAANLVDVLSGVERDTDETLKVFSHLQKVGITDENVVPVLEKLGGGFIDIYLNVEHICKSAPLADIKVIIEKFNTK